MAPYFSRPPGFSLFIGVCVSFVTVRADAPPERPPARVLRPELEGSTAQRAEKLRMECIRQRVLTAHLRQDHGGGDLVRLDQWIDSANDWFDAADRHREAFLRRNDAQSLEIALREYHEAWERYVTARLLPPEAPDEGEREFSDHPMAPVRVMHRGLGNHEVVRPSVPWTRYSGPRKSIIRLQDDDGHPPDRGW